MSTWSDSIWDRSFTIREVRISSLMNHFHHLGFVHHYLSNMNPYVWFCPWAAKLITIHMWSSTSVSRYVEWERQNNQNHSALLKALSILHWIQTFSFILLLIISLTPTNGKQFPELESLLVDTLLPLLWNQKRRSHPRPFYLFWIIHELINIANEKPTTIHVHMMSFRAFQTFVLFCQTWSL